MCQSDNIYKCIKFDCTLKSLLCPLEHAHTGPACPSDLFHTHPRNYSERTGVCRRGETGAVFLPASAQRLSRCWCRQAAWALEQTLLIQNFIICSYETREKNEMLLLKSTALTMFRRLESPLIHSPFSVFDSLNAALFAPHARTH